jgi:hypothetical protein
MGSGGGNIMKVVVPIAMAAAAPALLPASVAGTGGFLASNAGTFGAISSLIGAASGLSQMMGSQDVPEAPSLPPPPAPIEAPQSIQAEPASVVESQTQMLRDIRRRQAQSKRSQYASSTATTNTPTLFGE